MERVQNQVVAGIEYLPVVDANYRPILIGSRLRATVATYTGRLAFQTVELKVTSGYLPQCVIRGNGWCLPFFYDHKLQVMIGMYLSTTFPVWCELLPATIPFYSIT